MSLPPRNALDNQQTWETFRDWLLSIWDNAEDIDFFLSNQITWATGLAISATPLRQWTVVAGQAYVATENHIAGATFAGDLAAGKWLAVDVAQLESRLASSIGATIVGWIRGAVGAVLRTVAEKLGDHVNARDFGAVGNNIANDKAAIEAAAASIGLLGGVLTIPAGVYHSPSGFLFSRSNIIVRGEGMPRVSDDLTKLEGGTILRGTVLFDGDNITVEDLGADHGIDYSDTHKAGAGGDGLVVHKVGLDAIRKNINVRNVIGLTRIGDYNDATAAFHAVLLEGLRYGSADNVVGVGGWFGVVLKVADFQVGKVMGRENDTASVYLKSNSYAPVDLVTIESAVASNYTARGFCGVLIQSSDAELQAVSVGSVAVMGGYTALRVEGETTQSCVSVAVGQLTTRGGVSGLSARGPVYGLTIGNASIWEPSSIGVTTSANTSGTHPVDVHIGTLRVCPSATSSKAVDIGSAATRFGFGEINATAAAGSVVAQSIVNVQNTTKIGALIGTLQVAGLVPTLKNGWAAAYAQPWGLICENGVTQGYGRLSAAAATSDVFLNIPTGMRPHNLEFYTTMTAHAAGSGTTYQVGVKVDANGDCTIRPNRAAYTVTWFQLSDLRFPTRIPAEGGI